VTHAVEQRAGRGLRVPVREVVGEGERQVPHAGTVATGIDLSTLEQVGGEGGIRIADDETDLGDGHDVDSWLTVMGQWIWGQTITQGGPRAL
jgi:hypothetical protein